MHLGTGVIPSGAACAFLGFSQAAYAHDIQLLGNGEYIGGISNPSGSPSPYVMSGSAFDITDAGVDFTVKFTQAGPRARVIVEHESTTSGTKVFGGTWIFSLEDDTAIDCDYNDVIGLLSWTAEKG